MKKIAASPVVRSLFGWRSRVRRRKGKRAFTPNRRRIVSVKQNFGLLGIALLGGLVGVPVGALLAFKYFENRSDTLPVMIIAYAAWSALLTTLSVQAFI